MFCFVYTLSEVRSSEFYVYFLWKKAYKQICKNAIFSGRIIDPLIKILENFCAP